MMNQLQPPFRNLSRVKSKDVCWLWEPYIPIGLLTVWEGDPNVGKSYLAMEITAAVTTGDELPGGIRLKKGNVLYLSTER